MSEGEDAGRAGDGRAGGGGEGLRRAGGELRVLAVPPVVGDHSPVGVHLGGAPGGGGAGVGALVVLHLLVAEGEHAEAAGGGEAGVGHTAAHTRHRGHRGSGEVERTAAGGRHHQGQHGAGRGLHGSAGVFSSVLIRLMASSVLSLLLSRSSSGLSLPFYKETVRISRISSDFKCPHFIV